MARYFVYIMTNRSKTLYTGITNNLSRRMNEHRLRQVAGFTKRYSIDKLVYFEEFNSPEEIIRRGKQIKGWIRLKKIQLTESNNPNWLDLTQEINPE